MPAPLAAAAVAIVQGLLFDVGLSTRAAVRAASSQGVAVSRTTARRIQARGNEQKLDAPERCPACGGKTWVRPCRACRAAQARDVLARFRALQARLAAQKARDLEARGLRPEA